MSKSTRAYMHPHKKPLKNGFQARLKPRVEA
jgi:hypothetical protein